MASQSRSMFSPVLDATNLLTAENVKASVQSTTLLPPRTSQLERHRLVYLSSSKNLKIPRKMRPRTVDYWVRLT
jgi:hypothetical protein